ncbi:MAG: alpha/beta fold hydrolase [Spirochaetaceae bacterium]
MTMRSITRFSLRSAGVLLAAALLGSCASVATPGHAASDAVAKSEIILIHGAGEGPETWASEAARALAQTYGADGVSVIDWSTASAQRLLAPERGYRLGRALAPELSVPVTIIAHSAGAWLAQGLVDAHLESGGVPEDIRLVLLDPFTARAWYRPFAGARQLARGLEATMTYYTTLDSIPFTAGSVARGRTVNLDEALAHLEGSDPHWSVIDWYFVRALGTDPVVNR